MKITVSQKETIINRLETLYKTQWSDPIESILKGWGEAVSIVNEEQRKMLYKFGMTSCEERNKALSSEYISDAGGNIVLIYSPYTRQIIARFNLGKRGRWMVSFEIRHCFEDGSVLNWSEKEMIKAATLHDYSFDEANSIRDFVDEFYETNPNEIVLLKRYLENGFEELFNVLANASNEFAQLLKSNLDKCKSQMEANTKLLLDEFALNGETTKTKYTMFDINITKKEVEE